MTVFDKGDLVRVSAAFKDEAGAAVDPTTVSFTFRTPSGTETTFLHGTDTELVKDSVGNYHVDIDANAGGSWHWRFVSTGTGQAASEGYFFASTNF